jgi:UDP-N-acetylmuramoyl-L-alanyl-D-glutamate--2,6-diaminopimelate ligase
MGPSAAQIYGDPARRLNVLGITGTNGKTTTSFLLDAAARAAGRTTGLIGTIATFIAGERLPAVRTTPEATDLHRLLAVMLERGVDTVVMEVSSHALAMGRVGGVTFDVMGFTNLSQDHLDFHGSMEAYFEAKALAFTRERTRNAVIMRDDPAGTPWAEKMSRRSAVPTVTVSRAGAKGGGAGARYIPVEPQGDGVTKQCAQVAIGGEPVVVCTQLTGSWNLSNAVLAAVMAARAGIGLPEAAQGIAALASVPGRLEPVVGPHETVQGFVDYAHTPEAVQRVVSEVRSLVGANQMLAVVLGCGGDRDAGKRPLMGQAAAAHSDLLVVTDDNPRSEDPAVIRRAVISGTAEQSAVVVEEGDRAEAISLAVRRARDAGGGVVLVLGKGHEVGQEIAGQVVAFDDRTVLADALGAKKSNAADGSS